MCPQTPRLSPEYSHKAGLQTVITGMPLQIRPVTRGGHAGPVTMGRNARGPLSWTRSHCGMTSSPVFVWCRSSEGCPCLLCPCLTSGYQRRLRARGGAFAFAPTLVSLALVTIQLIARKIERKHDCKSQATRATNNTRITFSLKSLITNDLFSQL